MARDGHTGEERSGSEVVRRFAGYEGSAGESDEAVGITMDPRWMAEYEDAEVVKHRIS